MTVRHWLRVTGLKEYASKLQVLDQAGDQLCSIAVFIVVMLSSAQACAEQPIIHKLSSSAELQAHDRAKFLPAETIGIWTPYSENYRQLGDLKIGADTLTWGNCQDVRFIIHRTEGKASLIELVRSPPCQLRGEASFLIFEHSDRGMEVSICRDRTDFAKARAERSCSWGVLAKGD